jgi:hypothetical protein
MAEIYADLLLCTDVNMLLQLFCFNLILLGIKSWSSWTVIFILSQLTDVMIQWFLIKYHCNWKSKIFFSRQPLMMWRLAVGTIFPPHMINFKQLAYRPVSLTTTAPYLASHIPATLPPAIPTTLPPASLPLATQATLPPATPATLPPASLTLVTLPTVTLLPATFPQATRLIATFPWVTLSPATLLTVILHQATFPPTTPPPVTIPPATHPLCILPPSTTCL